MLLEILMESGLKWSKCLGEVCEVSTVASESVAGRVGTDGSFPTLSA